MTSVPGHCAITRSSASGEGASPPVITVAAPAKQSGSSSANRRSSAEVRNTAVTPWSAISSRTRAGVGSSVAMTISPPVSSGTHTSYVAASKACGEWNRMRRCAASRHRWSHARATTSEWVTATPFGVPVEPEVNMM